MNVSMKPSTSSGKKLIAIFFDVNLKKTPLILGRVDMRTTQDIKICDTR
jgi:hypothetical protein